MAIDWNAELAKITERLTETDAEIGQTESERADVNARYDQRLSVLYTEAVTLNGEARFARRMQDEQDARRAELESRQAESTPSPDAQSDAAPTTEDAAESTPTATTDTPSPEPSDTPAVPPLPEEPEAG